MAMAFYYAASVIAATNRIDDTRSRHINTHATPLRARELGYALPARCRAFTRHAPARHAARGGTRDVFAALLMPLH